MRAGRRWAPAGTVSRTGTGTGRPRGTGTRRPARPRPRTQARPPGGTPGSRPAGPAARGPRESWATRRPGVGRAWATVCPAGGPRVTARIGHPGPGPMARVPCAAMTLRIYLGHGASGTAASMAPHVKGLRKRGFEAFALDLPKRKAEDAVPAFEALVPDRPGVVVGGHSYGGRVASLSAAAGRRRYTALVCF